MSFSSLNCARKQIGAMRTMAPSEKRFFETLLWENYVKPDDRGEEWQSSYAIRCELRQELEGGRRPYDIEEMEGPGL
jgi:hypothetical protein